MIEKFSELNYTIHMSFFTGAKPLRKGAAGCWFGSAHRGRATPHEGLVQGAGRSCLADQLGLNMLLPLVMCLGGAWWAVNSWSWPEWVFLPAILLGLASGAQNFWYFAKEHLDRAKKEKPKRVGFNSHQ